MKRSYNALSLLLFLLLPLFLTGCVTTQKRYEKALRLEAAGRYADAIPYYVRVLEKEPGNVSARSGLENAGAMAVEQYLREADALADVQRFEQAVNALDRLDQVRARAALVGVALEVPPDYDTFRAEMVDTAFLTLVRRGEQAEEDGNFAAALQHYERALSRFRPTGSARAELIEARGRTMIRWAEADIHAGRPRAAFERAGKALELVDPRSPLAEMAVQLQHDAVAVGTQYLAFLPTGAAEHVDPPPSMLASMSAHLALENLPPPLFVALVDARDLQRELRRTRADRNPISLRDASEIARIVDADLAVLTRITSLVRKDNILREDVRKARTRGRTATDTTFVIQQLTVTWTAQVLYQLVDPHTRRVVQEGVIESAATSERFARGSYAGRWETLDLSRSDQRLFEALLHQSLGGALE